jgi:hypothetical protein
MDSNKCFDKVRQHKYFHHNVDSDAIIILSIVHGIVELFVNSILLSYLLTEDDPRTARSDA